MMRIILMPPQKHSSLELYGNEVSFGSLGELGKGEWEVGGMTDEPKM